MAAVSPTLSSNSDDPAWRSRLLWLVAALSIIAPAAWLTEFNPGKLADVHALKTTARFLATMFPPALAPEFLARIAVDAWRTIAIATVGTVLAVLIALPLALVANRQLSISSLGGGAMCAICATLRGAVRWILIVLRSIPEIVWALIFVRAVGLGDSAAVMAIALTYGGMLGKVYIEIFESQEAQASRALLANGASRAQAFVYATFPVCLPEFLSYSVYRWECAIRASVVMGLVGAGGLGQRLDESMKSLNGGEVFTILVVFVVLVWLADKLSAWLRQQTA